MGLKVNYTSPCGRFNVTIEAADQKTLFEEIASFEEVFCQQHPDGKVTRFVVRDVEDNKFYELSCPETGEKLSFGCNKKGGTLFPKRFDADKKPIGKQGWHKFVPEAKKA